MNVLAKRLLTAMIGIPFTIYIVDFGQWMFTSMVIILALCAWYEFRSMLLNIHVRLAFIPGILGIVLLLGCAWLGNIYETPAIITLIVLFILAKTILAYERFTVTDAAFSLAGFLYIGVLFAHLITLRFLESPYPIISPWGDMPAGAFYLWLAFLGTWASDTCAYFVGSKFGKTKLCPTLSPGKTREGAMGGLVGCLVVVGIFSSLYAFPLVHAIAIGLIIGIVAPIGDLVESAIKRFCKTKDSGNILPGHGGVLDRFDSILFTVPSVYYYLQLFILP